MATYKVYSLKRRESYAAKHAAKQEQRTFYCAAANVQVAPLSDSRFPAFRGGGSTVQLPREHPLDCSGPHLSI